MKINKSIIVAVLAVIFVVVTAVTAWYYSSLSGRLVEISCSSRVRYDLRDNSVYQGSAGVILNADGSGAIAYSGKLKRDTGSGLPDNNILRIIYFDYKKEQQGFFTLSNFVINKNISDTLADQDFNKIIFDYSAVSRRIKIKEVAENTYLIGNVFSPVFACVQSE